MGGEAAKERRRLKRLAQQQQNENGTVVESASSAAQEVKKGGNSALLRLQRKLARKASGKFKPQQASPSHKRKPESSKNRSPAARSSPAKKFKGGSDHSPKKRNNVKTAPVTKNMKQTKTKPKKPKHLKRKIEQLSEAMSGGSDVAQLDEQMKKLISQMEEFKKIKGNNSKVVGVVKNGESTPEIAQSKEPDVDPAQSLGGSISEAEQVLSNEEEEAEHEKPASSASDEDSSSDEEDIVEDLNHRSRGKRRRGRRESGNENSQNEAEDDKATKTTSEVESNKISADKTSVLPHVTDDDETKISKKTSKKDDKRRCIGRKPVTDFVVGEFYTGKVQYIKPRLGAFIDIGCHSDAFIHISCISDSYISSVDEILNVGDEVENARVVSIDREKKRVTLSLRSEDKAAESQKKKESNAPPEPSKQEEEKKTLSTDYNDISGPPAASSTSLALSTQKTGADLKRERKLARRAARRALQQGE